MNKLNPFHLAIPVEDLEASREFYGSLLGLMEGRSSDTWIDYNFYGHQLVVHLKSNSSGINKNRNPVDGKDVPIPHFGVVLDMDVFDRLAERLKKKNVKFIIEPYVRFKGEVGEQATMFFEDPSGNALEFKAFRNIDQLFAT